jgi:hypothetical protein
MPDIARRVGPPRVLAVPFALGYPLGAPHEPELQLRVLRALLALCGREDVPFVAEAPALG